MTLSLLRKSALALVAVAGLAATPALANGWSVDSEVIYADDGFGQPQQRHLRPLPPRYVEPQPYVQQDWQQDDEFMSPRQISRMLRHQGYGQVAEISLRGDEYRVVALRRNGAVVKLNIDAESGEILSVRRVGWAPRHDMRQGSGLTIEFGWDSRR